MNIDTLKQRIEQCVDDLGLLLDQIYKFPQKQRQVYFERIQGMKNKLLTLKGNAREFNCVQTQKQYKQLYITTNTLKNQIQQHLSLHPPLKENKEANRFKDFRDARKNYEQSIKLLASKDQEIKQVKILLYEKQELQKNMYLELMKIKDENKVLLESNKIDKDNINNYEIQFQRMKVYINQIESEIVELKIREQEKDKTFDSAIEQLERLKMELIVANQKIVDLNHQLEKNKEQIKMVQQTARKTDRKTQVAATQSFQDSFKKIRQVTELQYELGIKYDIIRDLQQQNKHLKQDIEVLDNQISKLQGKNNEVKIQATREKQNISFELKRIQNQLQSVEIREKQLKKLLYDADQKYAMIANQLSTVEEFKIKLKQSDFENQLLGEKIFSLQGYIQKLQADIKIMTKEKEKILFKQQRDEENIRSLEVEIYKINERIRIKDQDFSGLYHQLQCYKNKVREYQNQLTQREKKQKYIQRSLIQQKTRLIKLQQKQKARDKQIGSLKVKLLRAKIETIHEIRDNIN